MLHVVETFGVKAIYQQVLQQGLWLEALVSDVVESIACRQWAGRILGTDEVDIICIVANRIVMFECKDRSVGQNDLYVAAVKAQSLRADLVAIVSTQPLHANVQEVLTGLNAQRQGNDDKFTAIIGASAWEIKSQLAEFLNSLRNIELNNWLESRGRLSSLVHDAWSFSLRTWLV
jgi:hypothetical protein